MWKALSVGQFARVRWDIDGRSQCVGLANLQREAEEDWLEPPAEGRRVFQLFSYSSSTEGVDIESSSSSGSDDDASESVSEDESDIQSQSANGDRKRVLRKHSAQMPRKKSPADVDLNNGKVTAHGLEWKFVDDVSVDAYKDNQHKPKLRVASPASMSVLDFWLLFFIARALVKSFRKQTQGTNFIRNALQRKSCTRQLGFFTLWHLTSAGNAGIIGPLRALMTFFQHQHSVLVLNGQRSLWANTGSSFFWSSLWWHRPLASSKGTHQHTFVHLPNIRYMERRLKYTVWRVLLISKLLLFLVTKGQDELSNKPKSAYFKHFQDLGTCYDFLPKCPSGSASGRTRAEVSYH